LGSVFDLLGHKENDITFSVGWALSHSPNFLDRLVTSVFPKAKGRQVHDVLLQEHVSGGGYTDIELRGDGLHCIIEAKRGWSLPTKRQLKCYAARVPSAIRHGALLVLAECTAAFAGARLPKQVGGARVHYRSWRQVHGFADRATGRAGLHERALLQELSAYLEGLITMQNQTSNMVYVVSINDATDEGWTISNSDFVFKKRLYMHPFGWKTWPKEPPNYLGFRYNGRLRSICHVERADIVDDIAEAMPKMLTREGRTWHFSPTVVYRLGKAIVPSKIVRTGNLFRASRVWAAIDLLLTCDTVSEARDLTKKRFRQTT
jgi:hypothetical protein